MFGDRLALAHKYTASLADAGVVRGLIGPREVPRLWERHVLNSAVIAERLPEGAQLADVGSGAGLPGIPVAIARADLSVTLIEPLLRRTVYLEEIVEELGLDVEVLRARAEDVDATFEFVTARAVARLDKLARWCMPLVASGGSLLAMKGASAHEELNDCLPALKQLGAVSWSVDNYGPAESPTTVVEIRKR